jgi:hypothetical protein
MTERLVSDCIQILRILLEHETNVNNIIKKTGLYKNRVFLALRNLEKARLITEEKTHLHEQMKIKRLTPLGKEMAQFRNEISRFDESYFQLLRLVNENSRKLQASDSELSGRARSFGIPFFMLTLNAVIVRYSMILTSFKVNKIATIILTRMVTDEVTLRTESIPDILQRGYSGSDPTEFTQRVTNSYFKTMAMVFLELTKQTIPQGEYDGLTDLFEIKPMKDYIHSLNVLYRPSEESIKDIIGHLKSRTDKEEELRYCIPFFEKLLRSA